MTNVEFEKCACQHCESEQSPNAIMCYACEYTDCWKDLRNDRLFRRGYFANKAQQCDTPDSVGRASNRFSNITVT